MLKHNETIYINAFTKKNKAITNVDKAIFFNSGSKALGSVQFCTSNKCTTCNTKIGTTKPME